MPTPTNPQNAKSLEKEGIENLPLFDENRPKQGNTRKTGASRLKRKCIALAGKIPKVRNSHKESDLQISCFRWWCYEPKYKQYRKLLFHPANGEKRGILAAARLKLAGVESGVSDFILLIPRQTFHFMAIELKIGKGKLTEEQRIFALQVQTIGGLYKVCRNVDEFMDCVNEYLG